MGTRGKLTAVAGVLAAAVVAVVLLWPGGSSKPPAPTSDEIKASAQARLDASLLAGRKEQLAILATGETPSDDLCQKLWNRKSAADKAQLLYPMWLTGCADTPQP